MALLLVVYVLVLVLGDSRAGLGSDSGGKLATARVMADDASRSPDVGYWAADLDPEGQFHPLVNTVPTGDAWVQATSIPYSLVAARLWSIGGPAGVAALSMAGGVAAALAARRLARLLGGSEDVAFWLVGLGTPLAVYATDAWEHAPAVGLALWGVVLGLEAVGAGRAAAAGACFGTALVFRAEVAAYVAAFGLACLLVGEVRRRWLAHPRAIAAFLLALAAPVMANAALERLVLDAGVRDVRAASGASEVGAALGRRLTDAVLTGTGLFADESGVGLVLGVVLAAGLLVLGLRVAGVRAVSDRITRMAGVVVALLYLLRLADGWSFVPGALAAAPVVILALAARRTATTRVLLITAVGAVPVVWALQWQGNHVAQWGGRYLLLTTVLLAVLAASTLDAERWRQWPVRLLVSLTALASVAGLAWHVERTNIVGGAGEDLAALPPDAVVVSTQIHLGRELGSWYGEHRWLSADTSTVDEALEVARAVDPAQIAVIDRTQDGEEPIPAPEVEGYELIEERTVPYLGSTLEVRVLGRT